MFGQPASTDVARVLTCLFEKNSEFELVRIDTFKTHHKLPEFIRLRVWHLHQFFLFLFVLCFDKVALIPFAIYRIRMAK